jgi:copper chaperone
MKTQDLEIKGMSCDHCVMHVKKELSKLSAMRIEDVKIGSARVEYDETKIGMEDFQRAVEKAGYTLVRGVTTAGTIFWQIRRP